MISKLLIGISAATLTLTGTTAVAANSGAGAVAAKGDSKEEKKVCKRLKVSGTRMAEKVCLTKAEWAKVETESAS